jgi:hypothetical protein
MKQLTKALLKMNFQGIDLTMVSKIEFAFSQDIGKPPLKRATYPDDNTTMAAGNMIGIIWTPEETKLFKAGKTFYADTRITLKDSAYQPDTPIVKLTMNPTLFEE